MKEMLERLYERVSELKIFQPGGVSAPLAAGVVAGGLLLIGVIAWASLRNSPPPKIMQAPDDMPWICKNGHQFTMTGQQWIEHQTKHADEPVLCPICGAPADRAIKCPHCGNMVVPTPDHLCPVCKNPILHY